MNTIRTTMLLCGLTLLSSASLEAEDIYIAQYAISANSGSSCATAHSYSWFNSAANWGSGAGKIGAGDTVHLCGTITLAANDSTNGILKFLGAGTSESPIVLRFENGAVLRSPQFSSSGGILCRGIDGCGHVVIDGGTNGVVQNTANGTGMTYHDASVGVRVESADNVEIKNLIVRDIYQQCRNTADSSCTDTDGATTYGIYALYASHLSIHNNWISNARVCISYSFSDSITDTVKIYANRITRFVWGISCTASSGASSSVANMEIYGNDIYDVSNWKYPVSFHKDGIIIWKMRGNIVPTRIKVYNNYIYGDLTGGATAAIYATYGGGSSGDNNLSLDVYNNLIVYTAAMSGIAFGASTGGHTAYNNTLVNLDSEGGYGFVFAKPDAGSPAATATLKNNIILNFAWEISSYGNLSDNIIESEHNVYYAAGHKPRFNGTIPYTWVQWQAAGYDDEYSSASNPNLDVNFKPQTASKNVINQGINLMSTGLTSITYDKAGKARPSGSAWDIGAYQFSASLPSPQNLRRIR